MISDSVDATMAASIDELGRRVIEGDEISRGEALGLFLIEDCSEIYELLSWANRIRSHFKGNKVHLCSIVNIKAGGCPENCRFCAQSAAYETDSPRYGLVEDTSLRRAAEEAATHGVGALGLVAAWKGIDEGPALNELCRRLGELKQNGSVRPDASLGIIRNQKVADRLKQAGLECYNHNLETSRRFFPEICTTHTFDDRVQTIRHLKQAGVNICSGGIFGMGETRQDRCDLAFTLKELGVDVIPINFLNPIQGTPFATRQPLPVLEALQMIACFRFVLPRHEIIIAGGRTVNLRDAQSLIFMAGASGMMVGNYLTTLNQPVERDLQMIKDLGLDPAWERSGPCHQDPG